LAAFFFLTGLRLATVFLAGLFLTGLRLATVFLDFFFWAI
jgi:hypothetical protein